MVAEIGQQRLDARNGGMDIAVDPAGRHGGSAPRLVPIGARWMSVHASLPRPVTVSPAGSRSVRTFLRSEEHTSELQSLMRISYAVFCLKKKNKNIVYEHEHVL